MSTGQIYNKILILNDTKADGAGNIVQHPHTTNSQEPSRLIQNRRQCLGWAGCWVHLSSSPGWNTHSSSLCFSLDPTDPLTKVGKLSTCYWSWWFCHISFAQHHKHDPCWSQEGPDAQQGSSPHTRMSPLCLAVKPLGQEMQGNPGESSSPPLLWEVYKK